MHLQGPRKDHRAWSWWRLFTRSSVLLLAIAMALAGCTSDEPGGSGGLGDDAGSGDERAGDERTVEPEPAQIELVVEPDNGEAPLPVRMIATLVGEIGGSEDLGCATAAFTMGDGNVTHVRPSLIPCVDGQERVYEVEHVYASAGSFSANVRLIARSIPPSRSVPILIRGATPTPVPVAAIPGPTIIIATSAPPATEAPPQPTDDDGAPAPTDVAPDERPTVIAPIPIAPEPTEVAQAAISVLPADLYAIAGEPGRLDLLPASGAALETVTAAPVESFAVSSLGLIAVLRNGALDLVSPTGVSRTVADGGPSAPVWSRDGRQLAYAESGNLHLFDVVAFDDTDMGPALEPVRFSRSGERLLIRDLEGELSVVQSLSGARLRLPIEPADHAGWLPDADVLWLSGAGLRFVSLEPAVTVSTVIPSDVRTSAVFVRADQRAFVLARIDGLTTLQSIDLRAAVTRAETVGRAPLPIGIDADVAWSPDGRWLAVAGSTGLILLDPVSGASVPLVDVPSRMPRWSLAGR